MQAKDGEAFYSCKANRQRVGKKQLIAVCAALGAADLPLSIAMLPIDNAKFVAGQKFDFLVEAKGVARGDITVTINGVDAAKYFGKAARRAISAEMATYRIDGVSARQAGALDIAVRAGGQERRVSYTIVADRAKQRAKNVILSSATA